MSIVSQRGHEACKRLGWKTIPARSVETMTEEELRLLELEEDIRRIDLSDLESDKSSLARIRQAEADLKAKAQDSDLSAVTADKSKPKKRERAARNLARPAKMWPKQLVYRRLCSVRSISASFFPNAIHS